MKRPAPARSLSTPQRGEIYFLRLDSTEGSEQTGTRPAVIVSRDAINRASPVIDENDELS
ncbi:type II toxin-antitoxin system PemK/MazF family toxin [Candidatus Acetothermia bacterium]|nr:type II toxin-antitoxin system PemK/MazF family toxin [Candidatus Acetothermia bacterium]MBI3459965.1 type II toxin-antitoxin system PemK/MazF family toxin [Candidatus Acetothermia bacterium]MBI3661061.1 type II toxin-antitoxin system PemK/MazF family toxin [Candidatus Acetothermia bacterium]